MAAASFQRSAVGFIGYKLVTLYHVILHNATPGGKLEDFVSHAPAKKLAAGGIDIAAGFGDNCKDETGSRGAALGGRKGFW